MDELVYLFSNGRFAFRENLLEMSLMYPELKYEAIESDKFFDTDIDELVKELF